MKAKTRKSKYASIILVIAIVLCLFAGCQNDSSVTTESPDPTEVPSVVPDEEEVQIYPLCDPGEIEFEYWMSMFAEVLSYISDFNENLSAQEIEKGTGVHITWTTPESQSASEQFSVMIASTDYPDMIMGGVTTYTGGPDKAIEDGVYVALNDYVEEFAPDYYKQLMQTELYYKNVVTDHGNVWGIASLQALDKMPTNGWAWRSDIGADLGWSEQPATLEELDMFFADAAEAGYTGFFMPAAGGYVNNFGANYLGAWNTFWTFMNVDGTVAFGPVTNEYKEYLSTMNDWYNKGYINKDFLNYDGFDAWISLATGELLVMGSSVSGVLGSDWASNYTDDPDCYIAAMKPIKYDDNTVLKLGATVDYATMFTSITTCCEDVETAVRWINYWYTEAGHIAKVYGVEGTTFEYVDGVPTHTEMITNNPDAMTMTNTLAVFLMANNGPGAMENIYESDVQEEELVKWGELDPVYVMPSGLSYTPEEGARNSAIMNDIFTYVQESSAAFITGQRSIDEFDDYVAQIEAINIQEAIDIQQAALDRYASR